MTAKWLTAQEAADRLELSVSMVRKYVREGRIPGIGMEGYKRKRIPVEWLERLEQGDPDAWAQLRGHKTEEAA